MVQKKFAAITLLVAAAFVPALAVPMELDRVHALAAREFDNNELFQRTLGFDVRGLQSRDSGDEISPTPGATPQATPTQTIPNATPRATPTLTTRATSTQVTPTPTTTYTRPLATPTSTSL